MKIYIYILSILCLSLMAFTNLKSSEAPQKYKCMVQLKNYEGEGAYVILSVVDKDDNYIKTLHVLGDNDKWYSDLQKWWSFFKKQKNSNIDAITGATISGGERSIFVFELAEKDLTDGNKLRFETAVEHQDYHIKDLEIDLQSENLKKKYEGTGYIRYVRILAN